jgi:Arc/MetJ-type ribon-helix-helix transcriptional regulator
MRGRSLQKLIDERVNSGRYSSPEEVVEAAVLALEQLETVGDFDAGEPAWSDDLLAEGEQSIEQEGTLDGEDAFRLRAQRRAQRRNSSP